MRATVLNGIMTSEPTQFICPHCGQALEATPTNFDQTSVCPHCHTDLTISATAVDASSNPFEGEPVSADELDRNRIRQRFALRRALYRSRSYAIIAAVVCAVAVAQLGQSALHVIRGRSFGWAGLYICLLYTSDAADEL